ncbi:MAG TPA: Gfo/Idh/MocA family oxidoreductase [Opitutaceae bacterium]|jgi:predicted dehydrogenase|nr:Gfo/Idh/MocA family oxidoreductase [Opitutaceae bacterium]
MNRREFLAASAGVVLPAAASTPSFQTADGATYAPRGKPHPVVRPGEFVIAAVRLDHGHIYGMCNGLTEAGATLKWVYDPDPAKVAAFRAKFPSAQPARTLDEVLADPAVALVAAAAVTSERGPLGCQVMEAGKDYFTDKAPVTTMAQLEQARAVVARTGRKFFVYYSERLHNEAAMYATDLLARDVIGRVVQVVNLAPHRLSKKTRPAWFFERAKYGGILCDLGSHQFEQFLTYSRATEAVVTQSAVGNFANPDHPELEDFGEASLIGDTGASNYVRVDWYTPDGLSTWGDGRTFILGTEGTIELRKYVDIARDDTPDHVYLIDRRGEHHFAVQGKVGFRFFGEFILDCQRRTEVAMTQAHAFKTAEIALRAQEAARRLGPHLA